MITTVSPVNIHPHHDENFQDPLSQLLSNMQYSIINYSHHTIHYIPMTFYNWRFDLLTIFTLLPTPHNPSPLATTNLFSVPMSLGVFLLGFLDSTHK